ncbi:hypothetical protein BT93_E0786 [Corymbia citriodora subsp. variegata]|nr:hypothetical protein BT93_E0786 [Corymbia citriodora subsp. variegata]
MKLGDDTSLPLSISKVNITDSGENFLNFGTMDASQLPSSVSAPQEASHYDELSMKQSFNFSDSLKRLRMCETFIDHGGLSQQSLTIRTPKHHMQYILPVSKAKDGGDSKNLQYCMTNGVNGEMSTDIYPRNIEIPVSFARRLHSATQFPLSSPAGTFKFTCTSSNKKAEKLASPFQYQLTHSGSLVDRSASPNPSNAKRRYPSEPRRSTSMSAHVERNRRTDTELHSSKNKHLFKALLACGSQERTASYTSSWTRTKKNGG